MTSVNPKISAGQAFGIEFLITFVLILVVFGAAADDNNAPSVKGSAPLAIGLSITTCHLFAVSILVIVFYLYNQCLMGRTPVLKHMFWFIAIRKMTLLKPL